MSDFARQAIVNVVGEYPAEMSVANLVEHFGGLLNERDVRAETWYLIGEHRLTVNRDWTLSLAAQQEST